MSKEFIATFKSSIQITQDDYKVINPMLKITEETTIKTISDWYEKTENRKDIPMEVIIIKL